MPSLSQQTNDLRHALERAARTFENTAASLRHVQNNLPEAAMNAPTEFAQLMLNRHGFAVIHADQADAALNALMSMVDEVDGDSKEPLNSLIAYLKEQRRLVHR